jgi:hypothetical protein
MIFTTVKLARGLGVTVTVKLVVDTTASSAGLVMTGFCAHIWETPAVKVKRRTKALSKALFILFLKY